MLIAEIVSAAGRRPGPAGRCSYTPTTAPTAGGGSAGGAGRPCGWMLLYSKKRRAPTRWSGGTGRRTGLKNQASRVGSGKPQQGIRDSRPQQPAATLFPARTITGTITESLNAVIETYCVIAWRVRASNTSEQL